MIVQTAVTYTLVKVHIDFSTLGITVDYTTQLPGGLPVATTTVLNPEDCAAMWAASAPNKSTRSDDLQTQLFSLLQVTGKILK